MKLFRLTSPTERQLAASFCLEAPDGFVVSFKEPTRSEAHSRLMHSMARDLSKQVPWCGQTLSVEQWKRFATAKLKKDKIVFDCNDRGEPDPSAGLVVLGMSTRDKSDKEVGEIVAWFKWFGAQHNVSWTHEARELERLSETQR